MTLLYPQQTLVLLLFFPPKRKKVLENCKCAFDSAKMCSLAICKNSKTSELTRRKFSSEKKSAHANKKWRTSTWKSAICLIKFQSGKPWSELWEAKTKTIVVSIDLCRIDFKCGKTAILMIGSISICRRTALFIHDNVAVHKVVCTFR